MDSKNKPLHVTLPPLLRVRLDALHRRFMTCDRSIIPSLVEAYCDHIEKAGGVNMPFVVSAGARPEGEDRVIHVTRW